MASMYLCKEKTKILMGKCKTNNETNDLHLLRSDPEGKYSLSSPNVKLHPDNNGSKELYGITLLSSPVGTDEFKFLFRKEKI